MVTKEIIKKTFDKVLEVKHSNFLYNIEGTLREITDSKEEYKTLKEDIWKFYKETKNSEHEQMIIKGTDGSFFENRDGREHSVKVPSDAKDFFDNGGELMYMIHNHPHSSSKELKGSCFQSIGDISLMANYKVKYMVSLGDDGVMIVKNPTSEYFIGSEDYKVDYFYNELTSRYDDVFKGIIEGFHTDYDDKINKLKQEYDVDNKSYDELEEYRTKNNELLHDYLSKHIGDFVDNLSNKWGTEEKIREGTSLEQTNDAMDVSCYYVPRNPRVY